MAKKSKANAADAVGSMRVQPEHTQEAAKRSQIVRATTEIVEEVEIDDVNTIETFGTNEELERATVAKGHSVMAPIAGKRRIVGFDTVDKKSIYGPVEQSFGPDQEVILPRSEVVRLRATGHLTDPNRVYAAPGDNMQILEKKVPGQVQPQGARVIER